MDSFNADNHIQAAGGTTGRTVKYPDVQVTLTDGNAFAILAVVRKALRRAVSKEAADAYIAEATNGDYDHLLAVTMATVEAEVL